MPPCRSPPWPIDAARWVGDMSRGTGAWVGVGEELGGLLAFSIALRIAGLKAAIAATLLFVLLDGARRLVRRRPATRVWMLSNALALAGGAIDLSAATPALIRHEAAATNLLTAAVFLYGAFGRRPLVQEVAERWHGAPYGSERSDLRAFFRAFTVVWVGCFLVKALFYLWLTAHLPLGRALALRSAIGTGSFALMILLSWRGPSLFRLCRRCGLFAPPDAGLDPMRP